MAPFSTDTIKIDNVKVKSRSQWHGRSPTHQLDRLKAPASGIIIAHTATRACYSTTDCRKSVRDIQKFDMDSHGWDDVAYNFFIGGDGVIYEGRGFDYVGAHTKGFNHENIGIALIGTFSVERPRKSQFDALRSLITYGVDHGKISKAYNLYPQNSFLDTMSPGSHVIEEIKQWPNFIKDKRAPLQTRAKKGKLTIVPRDDWLAQPPVKRSQKINLPTKGAVIHHTETKTCTTRALCVKEVRSIQAKHIEKSNYNDIGYNFLIGGDGHIYEGVGWSYISQKGLTLEENFAFALVGTFDIRSPTDAQMEALQKLIEQSIVLGKMEKEYSIYPYNYFSTTTTSPGKKVIEKISSWPNYVDSKSSRRTGDKNAIISRDHWNASAAVHPLPKLAHPVPEVYIHHTGTNGCTIQNDCLNLIRDLQKSHIAKGAEDIKFNFLIGGDGSIYEGRGWDFIGDHTRERNNNSIGIALIGTFDIDANITPSTAQVDACDELVLKGVEELKIDTNYDLKFRVN